MCGIAGAYMAHSPQKIRNMLKKLAHRGPDGSGLNTIEHGVLGHTRLAIVDLETGHQPMHAGQDWISFNGEIYNHAALRRKHLSGEDLSTRSDTEVVLHLYRKFGAKVVNMLDGMFAFAIIHKGELFMARDPLGIKPLYYTHDKSGTVHFASEIKALSSITNSPREFPAGHWFHSKKGWKRYFNVGDTAKQFEGSEADARKAIYGTLRDAVVKRLMADVPVGISLSGGLDSSVVAALANEGTPHLHSFAVGVEGSQDLAAARHVAEYLGNKHQERIYTEQDMLEALPDVIYYLESFDPALVRSAIPNYFLAQLAVEDVKVILSGEGADELYAGYDYLEKFDESPDALQDELVHITEALHNTNLQRADRMSMAVGLEARVPFLDARSVSLGLSLPTEWKLRQGKRPAKALLRESFIGHLPEEIIYRPKAKFSKGAGSSDIMSQRAGDEISDSDFRSEKERLHKDWGYNLKNKEALYYYRVLRDHYRDEWIFPNMGHSRSL